MTEVYLFDWGDTLMVDFPGVPGKMRDWDRVEAIDGAAEALAHLAGRARVYVATGAAESTEADVAAALARVGLDRHVAGIFCTANLGVGKGDPGFFPAILDRLRLEPGRVTMVGDSLERDVAPAAALGLGAVWLARDPDRTPGPGVRVVSSLRELCPQPPKGAPMNDGQKNENRPPVNVHIKAEHATRFRTGTRWKVVAVDLESMWEDTYTMTLVEDDGADAADS